MITIGRINFMHIRPLQDDIHEALGREIQSKTAEHRRKPGRRTAGEPVGHQIKEPGAQRKDGRTA